MIVLWLAQTTAQNKAGFDWNFPFLDTYTREFQSRPVFLALTKFSFPHHDTASQWPLANPIIERRLNCNHHPSFPTNTLLAMAFTDELHYFLPILHVVSNSASPMIKRPSRRSNGKRTSLRYLELINPSYSFIGSQNEAYASSIIRKDHCGPITRPCPLLSPTYPPEFDGVTRSWRG